MSRARAYFLRRYRYRYTDAEVSPMCEMLGFVMAAFLSRRGIADSVRGERSEDAAIESMSPPESRTISAGIGDIAKRGIPRGTSGGDGGRGEGKRDRSKHEGFPAGTRGGVPTHRDRDQRFRNPWILLYPAESVSCRICRTLPKGSVVEGRRHVARARIRSPAG